MNIKEYNFPEMTDIDFAFSTICTCKKLLEEAQTRGYYNGRTSYNKLFSELFFNGGKLNFKKDIDEDFKRRATRYLKAFMTSFDPKHEEKEAISAMLLSELVDIEDSSTL